MAMKLYPLGLQTFSEIRERNMLYIDKTEYVYRIASSGKYFFLSRPRRFGKSLLVSTFKSYFEGKKELFKGLAIEKLEKEWTDYPVLHFDMSGGKHMDKEQLNRYLLYILELNEKPYGVISDSIDPNIRLSNLINTIYQQTGKQVVVLIDEYDAPLLDVVHQEENLNELRQIIRNFFSPLKLNEPYLRFVFLTGITKFSQLSIFSELNNIKNISMDEPYSGICGITLDELQTQMSEDIDALAKKMSLSRQQTIESLKENYDGYHFTWPGPDVFNPYSLLNCFADGKIDAYWFGSGTPSYLIEMMRKYDFLPTALGEEMDADKADFDAATETMSNIMPLLYQSGYITIKAYDPDTELYTLGIPNKEIRVGLFRNLMPHYLGKFSQMGNTTIAKMSALINRDNMDGALSMLKEFLATVPYCDNTNYEGHYQQLMFVIFSILSNYRMEVEQRTHTGRIDITIRTKSRIYIMELKFNGSAKEALEQIKSRGYSDRFLLEGLPVTKIGINFSIDGKSNNITEWVIE